MGNYLSHHAVWICMHFVHIPMVIRLLHELPIDASIRHLSRRIRKPPIIVVHCLFVRPRGEQHISHSSVAVPLLLDALQRVGIFFLKFLHVLSNASIIRKTFIGVTYLVLKPLHILPQCLILGFKWILPQYL